MVTPISNTNINIPQTEFLDATGRPSRAWLLWLQNPNLVGANLANPLDVTSGGTQVTTAPQPGQVLIGANGTYQLNNLTPGKGVAVVNGDGSITIDNTGLVTLSGGETGLDISGTDGNETLSGTLNATHGGTGQTTYAIGDLLYASATDTLSKLTKPAATSFLQMDSSGVPSWQTGASTVVTSFSGGTTGLTPSVATKGAITLGGVLAIANGGTGTSVAGASGSFTTADSKTVTVVNGFITSIV